MLALVTVLLFAAATLVAPKWHPYSLTARTVFWISAALIAIAVLGRTWAILYIDGRKYYELVDTGPYSICRNPLYVFSFFGAAGVGAASGSYTLALATLAPTAAVFYALVLREERLLRERFGEAYIAYCARVPRFLPRFRNWRGVDWVQIRPSAVVATFFEALLFALAYPAFFLIDLAQDNGLFPIMAVLP